MELTKSGLLVLLLELDLFCKEFELAAPVKNAPLQFRYVGAFQSPNDSFANNVGVQETRK